jgi:hypothetical protein
VGSSEEERNREGPLTQSSVRYFGLDAAAAADDEELLLEHSVRKFFFSAE